MLFFCSHPPWASGPHPKPAFTLGSLRTLGLACTSGRFSRGISWSLLSHISVFPQASPSFPIRLFAWSVPSAVTCLPAPPPQSFGSSPLCWECWGPPGRLPPRCWDRHGPPTRTLRQEAPRLMGCCEITRAAGPPPPTVCRRGWRELTRFQQDERETFEIVPQEDVGGTVPSRLGAAVGPSALQPGAGLVDESVGPSSCLQATHGSENAFALLSIARALSSRGALWFRQVFGQKLSRVHCKSFGQVFGPTTDF